MTTSFPLDKQVLDLIKSQGEEWDLASTNYRALSSVLSREIEFDGFKIAIQFNPERVRSSAAKVDAQSIAQRKCFLCSENLFKEQKSIDFRQQYQILVNPYPIFTKHLTIPLVEHVDQRIKGRLIPMLQLAEELSSFVVFYNGPKCGASAPDHFHFQAGNKGQLPIEQDVLMFNKQQIIRKDNKGTVFTLKDYLRKNLIYSSTDIDWMNQGFNKLYNILAQMQPLEDEPMMNILASYNPPTKEYLLIVFPRQSHRPKQFFQEGEKQLVFSPASVDFGGLFITVREEDYHKLNADLVVDMLGQLSISEASMDKILSDLA